jgi:hypothetical protein
LYIFVVGSPFSQAIFQYFDAVQDVWYTWLLAFWLGNWGQHKWRICVEQQLLVFRRLLYYLDSVSQSHIDCINYYLWINMRIDKIHRKKKKNRHLTLERSQIMFVSARKRRTITLRLIKIKCQSICWSSNWEY